MGKYAAKNKDRKEVFATLLALMDDIAPIECQDGQGIKEDEFWEGIIVTSNISNGGWNSVYNGTAKVTEVVGERVTLEPIKPGVTGKLFNTAANPFRKIWTNNEANFLFYCN